MKYGFVLPRGDARTAANLAQEAEKAGWDGFFVWEPIWGNDAWVCLTAAAMCTKRIRLGTMLSPLSRMRPWKLASETATLDNLSDGRVILAIGLGALDTGFAEFGEVTDRKERAELLDEGLDILAGLWKGQPFNYDGKHYKIRETRFQPPSPPIQSPRIPIWVVGAWPRRKSMERVLRFDGLLPAVMGDNGIIRMEPPSVEEVLQMKTYIDANRTSKSHFDIVVEGETPGSDNQKCTSIVHSWAKAGATWWLETMWSDPILKHVETRILLGPPKYPCT